MNFDDVVVRKPWGYEYLCYRNDQLAIWFLQINQGAKTSLHCHPKKHTGLVVLSGQVRVSFLRGCSELTGLDKIHIFRSRFHSTEALSVCGASILEIETPEDKTDLVRLEDNYGRAGLGYEDENAFFKKAEKEIWINEPNAGLQDSQQLCGCQIQHLWARSPSDCKYYDPSDILIITSGGLVTSDKQRILWPGDVIDGATLDRLANSFVFEESTAVIHVRKKDSGVSCLP